MFYDTQNRILSDHVLKICNTLYASTGYPTRYIDPAQAQIIPAGFESIKEPYEGYIQENIDVIMKKTEEKKREIVSDSHYMPLCDIIIYHSLFSRDEFKGILMLGPLRMIEANYSSFSKLDEKNSKFDLLPIKDYLESIQKVDQIQINSLQNLLTIVANTNVYVKNSVIYLTIDMKTVPASSTHLDHSIKHHSLQQEEKLLSTILQDGKSFESEVDLALGDLLAAPMALINPLRSEQNRFICSATTLSRAAIKLGVHYEKAFSYTDYFIQSVENVTSIEELSILMSEMIATFRAETLKVKERSVYNIKVRDIIDFVDEHIEQKLDLKSITKQYGYNYKYVSRLFVKEVGVTFCEYITKKKIRLAERLLKNLSYKIEDVSNFLNFSHQYYFNRIFKSYTGMTPSQYRNKLV